MSDAPRQESDPRARDDARPRHRSAAETDPEQAPEPDALGSWPARAEESPFMPAEAPDGGQGARSPEERAGEPAEDTRSREELLEALARSEAERDEYLDGLRRTHAEFENFRKRTMREGGAQREAGKAEVAERLLDVLDDLDRTLEATAESEDRNVAHGVELVAEKLVTALRAAGLERVDESGVPFDPNRHDAVQQTPAEDPVDEPLVAEVLRPGYTLGDRVLRAAMVVVKQ